jgi:hypothetical protein
MSTDIGKRVLQSSMIFPLKKGQCMLLKIYGTPFFNLIHVENYIMQN